MFLLVTGGNSFGQTSVTLKNILDGGRSQLVANAVVTVQDSLYYNPAIVSKLDTPYRVKNIVTFRINEFTDFYLPQFTATVNARIIYTRPDNGIDSVDRSFTINYDVDNKYTAKTSFVFVKARKVAVKVLGISITGTGTGNVLYSLVLENEMQVFPVYKLSCTDDAVKSITAASTPNTDSTDEVTVSWPITAGADNYDLEWTYVDSSAYTSNKYGNPVNPALLFRNNSSRVTIRDNNYRIPLLYDNGCILFFRVRAVQEKVGWSRIETAWSSDYTGGLGSFGFVGHQKKFNWSATVDYAENGKRNAVVEYYDGSLRNRQTVTKDNTTNRTIVGESFYDYQGRPAIEVMPAPSLNTVIKYSPRFNSALNGAEYDKSNYDQLNSSSEYETASAAQMSSASGANRYYSKNNPEKDGINQFIPEAGNTQNNNGQGQSGRI